MIPVALDFAEARRIFHAAEEARLGWWKLQQAVIESPEWHRQFLDPASRNRTDKPLILRIAE